MHLFQRFHMPDSGNSVFWYAFGSHNLWMVTLSTEHSLEPGSPQRAWFEAQLATVNRTVYPWLVVAMHRPMYTSEYEVRACLRQSCSVGCTLLLSVCVRACVPGPGAVKHAVGGLGSCR